MFEPLPTDQTNILYKDVVLITHSVICLPRNSVELTNYSQPLTDMEQNWNLYVEVLFVKTEIILNHSD